MKRRNGKDLRLASTARPTAREAALSVLVEVERSGAYSNLMLNQVLKDSGMARQEAALATELLYGTLQRRNTLDYYLQRFVRSGLDDLQDWVRNLLRISLYQLVYLDRVPQHAIVHEAVEIAKRNGHSGISGLVNGVLRNAIRQRASLRIPGDLPEVQRIALAESHPEWFVRRMAELFGARRAAAICAADNVPPRVSLRVNPLRAECNMLLAEMAEAGIRAEPSALSPSGILAGGGNMADSRWYASGEISIQDESSMLVAEVLAPAPGMKVLDACAAPGGKAAHAAEWMRDEGEIWAGDVHPHKVRLLRDLKARLGLSSLHPYEGDALDAADRFAAGSFDRILLDAPCSGLGIFRRKPDLKWTKTPENIRGLPDLQYRLLTALTPLLKPGGIFVYSTCTLWPEENEELIRRFLSGQEAFRLSPIPEAVRERAGRGGLPEGMLRILPDEHGSDGFFICRMIRGG